jgi:hypothetical protein
VALTQMKTFGLVLFVILTLGLGVGLRYVLQREAALRSRYEVLVREALFEEIQPVALSNCTLKRYGSAHDGGYLMCENLNQNVRSAYSYGINREDNWGCDVARELMVPVHQYDCFTEHRPVCQGGQFIYHNECVGPVQETSDGRPFDTIANQIQKNGDAGKEILLKIDVEGAEWDSFLATPEAVLDRIVQIPMELHGTNEGSFLDAIRKLKKTFYVVSVNYNNWACSSDHKPFPAWAYQVLLVNKRVGVLDPSVTPPAPPSPLLAVDNPDLPACSAPSP